MILIWIILHWDALKPPIKKDKNKSGDTLQVTRTNYFEICNIHVISGLIEDRHMHCWLSDGQFHKWACYHRSHNTSTTLAYLTDSLYLRITIRVILFINILMVSRMSGDQIQFMSYSHLSHQTISGSTDFILIVLDKLMNTFIHLSVFHQAEIIFMVMKAKSRNWQ